MRLLQTLRFQLQTQQYQQFLPKENTLAIMVEPGVGRRYNIWNVFGFTVTLGNSCMLSSEHRCDRDAHDITSA